MLAESSSERSDSQVQLIYPVRAAAYTVRGSMRTRNEDRFYVDSANRVLLVADGIGGTPAGDVASELACRLLSQQISTFRKKNLAPALVEEHLQEIFEEVNNLILVQRGLDSRLQSMGTTALAAVLIGEFAYIAGVGDSRAYLIRDHQVTQLTVDDTVAQALVDAGLLTAKNARTHPYRKVLSRYLGSQDFATGVEVKTVLLRPSDRLLLCTNGLTDRLEEASFVDALRLSKSPEQAAWKLVEMALHNKTTDDTTCVVVYVD
ncbi:MAG: serine/threonine-protein phosphatase [Planctomycetes bacterium]|nr:serine/threonine-protein phosphatase [Planctomycetota bacterium]MCH9727051.1 serine/threonine-protein phosphatase [Planctomycetota bacterium]MCH9774994.1 serine/threonine-protein phosphatase [Planctomycetota bacterium]MCH9789237.1 serine/threonine-protein phosphatase [Planctomycetota bacterium]